MRNLKTKFNSSWNSRKKSSQFNLQDISREKNFLEESHTKCVGELWKYLNIPRITHREISKWNFWRYAKSRSGYSKCGRISLNKLLDGCQKKRFENSQRIHKKYLEVFPKVFLKIIPKTITARKHERMFSWNPRESSRSFKQIICRTPRRNFGKN